MVFLCRFSGDSLYAMIKRTELDTQDLSLIHEGGKIFIHFLSVD